jgi:hypothetical protein
VSHAVVTNLFTRGEELATAVLDKLKVWGFAALGFLVGVQPQCDMLLTDFSHEVEGLAAAILDKLKVWTFVDCDLVIGVQSECDML